jgi:hypothetical protein
VRIRTIGVSVVAPTTAKKQPLMPVVSGAAITPTVAVWSKPSSKDNKMHINPMFQGWFKTEVYIFHDLLQGIEDIRGNK